MSILFIESNLHIEYTSFIVCQPQVAFSWSVANTRINKLWDYIQYSRILYLTWKNLFFYSVYLHRLMLYRQPIWQCETTGRSNLTYAQALESERKEKERVGDRFPERLKAGVLKRLQFRTWYITFSCPSLCMLLTLIQYSGTDRLEAVVEDIYSHFLDQYLPGEVIHCKWDDGIM
jgi:hypothetical protein